MESKNSPVTYKIIKGLVHLFFGNMEVEGLENLPEKNTVIVANHCQMNGPIAGELFMPDNCYTWCAGQMMHVKEVPEYAFQDFWSRKPKCTHPYFKLSSYIIAPFCDFVFRHARTIAVYRDMRIIGTFKESIKALQNGANLLIFPEKDEKHNNILYQFQENFIDVAKLYYKKTGIALTFVPMYIAPTLKTMHIGKPVTYDPHKPIESQRTEICKALKEAITDMAVALPEHRVIPYQNIPRKQYLMNKKGRGSVEADTGSGLSQVSAEKNQ